MDARTILLLGVCAAALLWLLSQNNATQSLDTGFTDVADDLGQGVSALDDNIVASTATGSDEDTLARTIRGEAANQIPAAKQGVGSVVLNRNADPLHYPSTAGSITAICKQKGQFDCWSPALGSTADFTLTTKAWTTSPSDVECQQIAKELIAGTLTDNTGGAEYYHDATLGGPPASWGAVQLTARIGAFSFYRRA